MSQPAAASPHLLLLPGLLCDAAVWQPQVQALQLRWPGLGCTVARYGMCNSLEAMAHAALAQADADGVQGPLYVAGHSMGGRVALEIWRMASVRVVRLALLDTGAHPLAAGDAGARERANRMALVQQSELEGMRAMGQVWAQGMVHPSRLQTPVFEAILQMIERSSPVQFAAQQNALLARRDATPLLGQVTCPTLVLCGRQDQWSNPAQHQALHAGLAQASPAELCILEDCGHMSTMEQPAAVSLAMARWLAS